MRCNVEKPQIATVYALSSTVELCSANSQIHGCSKTLGLKPPDQSRLHRLPMSARSSKRSKKGLSNPSCRGCQSKGWRMRMMPGSKRLNNKCNTWPPDSSHWKVWSQHKQHTAQVQGLQTQVVSQMPRGHRWRRCLKVR